jgi:hypothetical protein
LRPAHASEIGILQPVLEVLHDDLPDRIRLLLEQPIPRRPVGTQPVEGLTPQAATRRGVDRVGVQALAAIS